MKQYSKAVENSNNPNTGFKLPNQMRPSIFSGGKSNFKYTGAKVKPPQYRTQHKGK